MSTNFDYSKHVRMIDIVEEYAYIEAKLGMTIRCVFFIFNQMA